MQVAMGLIQRDHSNLYIFIKLTFTPTFILSVCLFFPTKFLGKVPKKSISLKKGETGHSPHPFLTVIDNAPQPHPIP